MYKDGDLVHLNINIFKHYSVVHIFKCKNMMVNLRTYQQSGKSFENLQGRLIVFAALLVVQGAEIEVYLRKSRLTKEFKILTV